MVAVHAASAKTFPLRVYEQTDEFQQEWERAERRYRRVLDKLRSQGFRGGTELRLKPYGGIGVWIYSAPHHWKVNLDLALSLVRQYSFSSYWELDEFEDFLRRGERSRMFRWGMWHYGFRPHAKRENQWVRVSKGDKRRPRCLSRRYPRLRLTSAWFELDYLPLLEGELARVNLGKTWCIEARARGMVSLSYDINPFVGRSAEQMGQFGREFGHHAHLAVGQDGFSLTGRNLFLGSRKEHSYVLLTLTAGDRTRQVVWPMRVAGEEIVALCEQLAAFGLELGRS